MQVLKKLISIIKKNKKKNPNISYTALIFKKGLKFCISKFVEESKELAIISKTNKKKKIISESVDMFYHFLVLLEYKKIKFSEIIRELAKRQKISGIQEKKSRKKNVRQK
jgi:phosphoribosyl-ATP pyrophosphohydrolase